MGNGSTLNRIGCRSLAALFVAAAIAGGLAGLTGITAHAGPVPVDQLDDVQFDYPMTVINSKELQIVRQRIEAGEEPQASAYAQLIKDADAAQTFTPDPPAHMEIMGGYEEGTNLSDMRDVMQRESEAAYASALAWLYSGEQRYADKAVEILDAWSEKGTRFGGGDAGLQLGSWFNRMLYAADIMRGYDPWTRSGREQFEHWWREAVLPHVRDAFVGRTNNWQDAGVLGVITAAVAFEDRELLREALIELDSYFSAPQGMGGRDPKMHRHQCGPVYFPAEVTRSGRDIGPGGRGLTYTAYTLTSLVQAMEIARHAGFNWWDRKAENGATLKEAVASYIRWMDLGVEFPWHDEPYRYESDGPRRNPHEIIHNHFPGYIDGLKQWLAEHRPVNGRQGDPYVTLNRGDVPPR